MAQPLGGRVAGRAAGPPGGLGLGLLFSPLKELIGIYILILIYRFDQSMVTLFIQIDH